jgi:hypothetical protein
MSPGEYPPGFFLQWVEMFARRTMGPSGQCGAAPRAQAAHPEATNEPLEGSWVLALLPRIVREPVRAQIKSPPYHFFLDTRFVLEVFGRSSREVPILWDERAWQPLSGARRVGIQAAHRAEKAQPTDGVGAFASKDRYLQRKSGRQRVIPGVAVCKKGGEVGDRVNHLKGLSVA